MGSPGTSSSRISAGAQQVRADRAGSAGGILAAQPGEQGRQQVGQVEGGHGWRRPDGLVGALVQQGGDTEQPDPVADLADHLGEPEPSKHRVARDRRLPERRRPADAPTDPPSWPAARAPPDRSGLSAAVHLGGIGTRGTGAGAGQIPIMGGSPAARRSASSLTIDGVQLLLPERGRRSSLGPADQRDGLVDVVDHLQQVEVLLGRLAARPPSCRRSQSSSPLQ